MRGKILAAIFVLTVLGLTAGLMATESGTESTARLDTELVPDRPVR